MEPQKPITHEVVAEAALPVLEQHPEGLLLSRLGQDIKRAIGDFRAALGSKRLGDILREQIGSRVLFSGHGPEMRVLLRPAEQANDDQSIIHFEPRFWAAFAKPIRPPGARRWIQIEHPFQFDDVANSDPPPSGTIEVQSSYIPSVAIDRGQRAKIIIENIKAWCKANSQDQEQFRSRPRQRQKAQDATAAAAGVAALRALVEAVPEGDRSKHSLSLDLIGLLLRSE